ncbi:MAG: hypothetical protein WCT04_12710 [Planctomycetota bacterium]
MSTVLELKRAETPATSEYDVRVLFLSGNWEKPGSKFGFRATIYIEKDGTADGAIYWRAYQIGGQPASYFATEAVFGCVRGPEVELEGHDVEPGLAQDAYKITLNGGDDAGTFAGITRADNWKGRVDGTYQFRNRKS